MGLKLLHFKLNLEKLKKQEKSWFEEIKTFYMKLRKLRLVASSKMPNLKNKLLI